MMNVIKVIPHKFSLSEDGGKIENDVKNRQIPEQIEIVGVDCN